MIKKMKIGIKKMEAIKFMFTANEQHIDNVKSFLTDNNITVRRSMELDAGVCMLFMVTCTQNLMDTLQEECQITLLNGNMQLKQC